jgi:TfoX/Sxy family transcriptional regulator of competence genes
MGKKGDKDTGAAAASAERLVPLLAKTGGVTSKKMFGGVGVFESIVQ